MALSMRPGSAGIALLGTKVSPLVMLLALYDICFSTTPIKNVDEIRDALGTCTNSSKMTLKETIMKSDFRSWSSTCCRLKSCRYSRQQPVRGTVGSWSILGSKTSLHNMTPCAPAGRQLCCGTRAFATQNIMPPLALRVQNASWARNH